MKRWKSLEDVLGSSTGKPSKYELSLWTHLKMKRPGRDISNAGNAGRKEVLNREWTRRRLVSPIKVISTGYFGVASI
jgi:hypothetical protein